MTYVPLHCHTDFSLLDGTASIPRLIAKAKALGLPAMAITDHANLFGALKLWKEAKKQGIKPIIGCELYVTPTSRLIKEKGQDLVHHLILLAKTDQGYRNLSKLSSLGFTEGFYEKPRVDWELLQRYSEGLICLSACLAGEIPQLILAGKKEAAKERALEYQALYGVGNYYLELQDHGIEGQKIVNPILIKIAKETGIPLVVTNNSHYVDADAADSQTTLISIMTGQQKSEIKDQLVDMPQFYVKSPQEMAALFPEVPEALSNTLVIAQACVMEMKLPGPLLPEVQVSENFTQHAQELVAAYLDRLKTRLSAQTPRDSDGDVQRQKVILERLDQPISQYFVWLSNLGLKKRYPQLTPEIAERLDDELLTIINLNFVDYFMVVADFIGWAKDHDIPVGPGRGSGPSSIVAYSLRITDIDPIKFKLHFERFLNPERVSMPDFDVDFCNERRSEVIDYVTEHYGTDRVSQIITFGTFRAKAALNDVACALGFSVSESNALSALIPSHIKISLKRLLDLPLDPEYVKAGLQENHNKLLAIYHQGQKYRELFDTAIRLEGLIRHTSTHTVGIVIGKSALTDFVPLYRDPTTGATVTQFASDQLEECGLVMFDFLGLKTLTWNRHTLNLITQRGITLPEKDISQDDPKTFQMLSEGHSESVFQFESTGMQKVLKQAQPSCLEDLVALNALYRPGPMEQIPRFIAGKQNPKNIDWVHPDLKDCLQETYGVIVYQEQIMEIAQIIAGYSLGRADVFRRIIGKGTKEEKDDQETLFITGAEKKGYDASTAKRIFDNLVLVTHLTFNKSHAVAYTTIAYETAYLKANYPEEFMATQDLAGNQGGMAE